MADLVVKKVENSFRMKNVQKYNHFFTQQTMNGFPLKSERIQANAIILLDEWERVLIIVKNDYTIDIMISMYLNKILERLQGYHEEWYKMVKQKEDSYV